MKSFKKLDDAALTAMQNDLDEQLAAPPDDIVLREHKRTRLYYVRDGRRTLPFTISHGIDIIFASSNLVEANRVFEREAVRERKPFKI